MSIASLTPLRKLGVLACIPLFSLATVPQGLADSLYWNGTAGSPAPAGGAGGNGNWNLVDQNWTRASGGAVQAGGSLISAVFGGAAGTVTINQTVSASRLSFETDGYTLLSSAANLDATALGLTISSSSGVTAIIDALINTGTLVKEGNGNIILGANNILSAIDVRDGGLYLSSADATDSAPIRLGSGTTFGVAAGHSVSFNSLVTIDGDISIDVQSGDALEFAYNVNLGSATRTLSFIGSGETLFRDTIDGNGGLTLLAGSGTPTITMWGTRMNTYSGQTSVGSGVHLILDRDPGVTVIPGDLFIASGATVTLQRSSSQISSTATVQLDGTLAINTLSDSVIQFINVIQGDGVIRNEGANAVLSLGTGHFSGQITEAPGAAALSIQKFRNTTLRLSGANSYTGETAIWEGRLETAHQSALGTSHVRIRGGTLAILTPLSIKSLAWESGMIAMTLGSETNLLIDGSLTMMNDGTFEFSGAQANTLYTLMTFDTLGSSLLDFSAESLGGRAPTFTQVNNGDGTTSLQLIYAGGAIAGPVLSNAAPYYTPTDADFFVEGPVATMPMNGSNIVNALIFAPGGSLQVSNELQVTSGDFTVDEGSASVSGGTVIAPEDFTKLGNGVLIANSNFSVGGEANIEEGGLYVNGTFQAKGGLNVLEDAMLGGSGLIVGDVTNDGTVAPGNSPGVLSIDGDFVQTEDGTLQIEVESGSVFDQLLVTGNADIDGTLEILSDNLSYGQVVPFLVAGSISGAFDEVIMPNEDLFRARMLLDDGTGILLVAPTSYTLVAETQNQTNVAAALDGFIPATSGDRETVSIALDQLPAEQYPAAFDQISPAFYESLADITLEQNNAQNQMLAQRFSSVRLGARGFQSMGVAQSPILHDKDGKSVLDAKSGKDIISPTEDNKWGLWVMGNGLFANAPSLNQMPAYKFQSGGFLGGVDYSWNEHFATGIFAGYQGLYAKYDGGSKNTINSTNFGVYATFQKSGFTADAVVSGAYNSYSTRRPIEFGTVDRTGVATPDGGQVNAYLGLGYDWKAGNFTFGPILSAQYTYVGIGSFEETGADSLDLRVDQQSAHSIRTSVGGRIAYTWNVTEHIILIPEVRMIWQHEFLNDSRTIGASLDGGSGASFDYLTAAPGRDNVYAGAGVTAQIGRNWNANLFYNADFGRQDFTSHMVSGGLGWEF